MEKLNYIATSFVGRRSNNQDSCSVVEFGNNTYLLAVADGMGGVQGGQVASKLVLEHCSNYLKEELGKGVKPEQFKEVFERIFPSAQNVIHERVKKEPGLAGMGTTLTAVLIQGDKYVWGNIGDSRTYLLSDGEIKQLSVDHTYIQDYKNENEGDIPQSIIDQYSHYLTRALDGGSDVAEIFPKESDYETLKNGETLLLCSDGLITNKVDTNTDLIREYVIGSSKLKRATQNLICTAFYDGSKDNISVVIAEYGELERKNIDLRSYLYPPSDNTLLNFVETNWKNLALILFIIILLFIILM